MIILLLSNGTNNKNTLYDSIFILSKKLNSIFNIDISNFKLHLK